MLSVRKSQKIVWLFLWLLVCSELESISAECADGFEFPTNCSLSDTCQYEVKWSVDSVTAEFMVKTVMPDGTQDLNGFWTGVAFNEEARKMDGARAILLSIPDKGSYDNQGSGIVPRGKGLTR